MKKLKMLKTKLSFICIFCSVLIIGGSKNTGSSLRTIEGLINKNAKPGTEVWLKSDLVVDNWQGMNGAEVCGYGVKHPQLEHPFRVLLLNSATGLAKVVVGEGRSLDSLTSYVMDIYPYDCTAGAHGLKTRLTIKICESTAQAFDRLFYEGFIFEREFDSKIVCLESSSNNSADVCNQHVITPLVPFNVDEFGCIYNTKVLDFNSADEKVMNFQVLAEYCNNQGVSTPVEVNIKVLCNHLNWEEFKSLNITNPKGDDDDDDDDEEVNVMNNAKLDLCDESCIPSVVTTSLHLKLSPLLEQQVESSVPYPLQTLYKLCGVLLDVLDLLPSRSEPNSWTRNLPSNEIDFQHSYPEFNFNGVSTFSEIFLDQSVERFVDFPFSVSWSMLRNMFSEDAEDFEHLMCFVNEVDSRQYMKFSVSLHKCKLFLRLFRDSDTNITTNGQKSWHGESKHLSEWSWNLEGVCDGDWHDYIISLDLEKIIVHVDGKCVDEIAFDERLFRGRTSTRKASVQKFYVGSCKHEESREMKGFLKASVSGLHVLLNKTSNNNNSNINNCIQSFEDKLKFSEKHSSFVDDDKSFNVTEAASSKKVSISAKNVDVMEKLTSHVVVMESPLPTASWKRNVLVQTFVECQDGRKLMAEDLLINIQQENVGIKTTEVNEDSKTENSGQDLMENVWLNMSKVQSFKETDYKIGVRFMKDLKILSDGKTKSKKLILLDACLVQFNSKLDKDKDKITGFDSLASKQHLIVAIYDFGISFTGVGRPQDYEMLLRSLSLETKDASKKRSFNVGCSFRGKQTRNLSVMLDVIHEDHIVVKGHQNPHRLLSNKVIHPAMFDNLQLIAKPFPVSFKYNTAEDSGAGVALVMIVCIGFIVLLIVLGIVRIRSLQIGEDSNPKTSVEDPEFNIILNPIHPDNISKKEDGTNECFHERNKLNVDCEDSDEESFGISEETQRDWKNSAVLL